MTDFETETTEPVNLAPRYLFEGPRGPLFAAMAAARPHYLSLTADSQADVQLKGGGGYKHSYADLDTVIRALTPGWVSAGLTVIQLTDGNDLISIVAAGESSLTVACPLPRYDTPQQMASGVSYIRRYQLKCLFCVNDSEDDDANAAQGNKATIAKKPSGPAIPEALTKAIYAAAKANGLAKPEFLKLAYDQAGRAFVDYDEADAQKLLSALVPA